MLTHSEALALEKAPSREFEELSNCAAQLRNTHWGRTLTYSRKVFVPLTNMCRDDCGYCTFVQKPGSPAARVMTPDEVMAVVKEGERLGCKEVLFSLGEKPELRYAEAREALARLGHTSMIDYLIEMCRRVLDETDLLPHVNAGTLSDTEIARLKPVSVSMGMMLENISRRLLQRGQAHYACPDKVPVQRLRTLERAGQHGVPFTTGILIGIGETWAERVDSLMAINALHQSHGHIQEVIVQNFRAKPGTAMANHPEPDLNDMVRTLVLARLLLHPSISLQAPPNLESRFAAYIGAGINDWGGISPVTIDHINPERAWPQIEALRQATARCGYGLEERLAVYPRYLKSSNRFLAAPIAARLDAITREDGLALQQCG
ncbi:7,8-didemethyl-8-hydroxy-5-deazariboflavin synthase CofG [Halomonas icarae]|uniref:7,8-didemethyl-8-hydroxy-5-deazariboflavin synthase n=1 Tax=Halomonas icarae TaxID=2691040 RepID=A0A7X4VZZ6_9GAMM|nr:7,8-didemethyl-8-hydroxy-5-deazariboflavin synthase CofG [Halomonas icarae]MDR5903546.1 7,8-didemethyl-8-hydroxy-5-deazariboflavin synthase CofG [Halomonas icarae]NAW13360.1 7,8-didemethyl-8-hydroxy-5-deazariboflavin synthase CofG [Halomonas icarae]